MATIKAGAKATPRKRATTPAANAKPKRGLKPETVRLAFQQWFVQPEDDEGEIRSFCPVCEDPMTSKTPSASINPDKGIWNCQKGNHGGSIQSLAADLKKTTGFNVKSESMKNRFKDPEYRSSQLERLNPQDEGTAQSRRNLPSQDQLEALTERLLASPKALNDLTSQRGFTKDTIAEWDIGFDGERYTIPVRNGQDDVINVRRYKLNAARAQDKMLNIAGHGSAAIFGLSILRKNDVIVVTEGETDCILLNQHGIPAVTHTAGAATFRPAWGQLFADKTVFVCYDNDKPGMDGARKVKKTLDIYAESVSIIDIPIDAKGADVTDYLHKEGFTADDFKELMREAGATAEATIRQPIPGTGKHVSLTESMSEALQNDTLEMTVSIAGKQQEPYTAPKTVIASCDMSKGAACTLCPIAAMNGEKTVEMRQDDSQLFRFVDSSEERRAKLLKEVTGARCSDRVEFTVPDDYHIEELMVQPSIDDRIDGESQTPIKRPIFSVSTHKSGVNEKRRIVGRNTTDPKTGKLKFMAWQSEPLELDIDKFILTDEDRTEMKRLFQPEEDQTSYEKALEISEDLAQNVTHIYGRDLLHVAYDLVWHSVLSFRVHDLVVDKGWLEMMVVGDTRTGKSDIAKGLIRHYRSGELLSCEGMSFAGIVGGVQQVDGRWHMTWGAVPMNDRRLVVLDEVSGLKEKNIIEQMSAIRSSGVAQITKIQSEQTSARTRMIWITNPADGSMLADSPDLGMSALKSVVPNNEDIARFDFVAAAQKGDVSNTVINSTFEEGHDTAYSSEMSEKLIKWVWSLTKDKVVITKSAADEAVKQAIALGERYVADPPLIQPENVRYKVLRIAAALAARTFSINGSDHLVVKRTHVVDAVTFLDDLYEQEAIGYARRSRKAIAAEAKARDRKQACKQMLLERREDILHTLQLVGGNNIRQSDFVVLSSMSKDEADIVCKQLLNWRMIDKKTRGDMRINTPLMEILREIDDEDDE